VGGHVARMGEMINKYNI